MSIILSILVALSWIILLSVKSKKPEDPLIQLREELEFADLDPGEINDIVEKYKSSYSYACYELKKSYYELGQAIKNSFKK